MPPIYIFFWCQLDFYSILKIAISYIYFSQRHEDSKITKKKDFSSFDYSRFIGFVPRADRVMLGLYFAKLARFK